MKPLISFLRLDIILLHRNRLFYLGILSALIYIGIFFLFKGTSENLNWLLVLLLFNDPLITGFLFGGVLWLFDRNQNTMSVIRLLPVNEELYFVSKILVLAVYAFLLSVVMASAMYGFSFNWFHLAAGVFMSSAMLTAAGFIIVSSAGSFNMFLLYSVPFFILTGFPFLQFAGVGGSFTYILIPTWGGVGILRASVEAVPVNLLTAYYLHCMVSTAAGLYILRRKKGVLAL